MDAKADLRPSPTRLVIVLAVAHAARGAAWMSLGSSCAGMAGCEPRANPARPPAAAPASKDPGPKLSASASMLPVEPPLSPIAVFRGDEVDLCVALANGHTRCWGDNRDGKLGFTSRNRVLFRPIEGPTPQVCLAAGEGVVDFAMSEAVNCVLLSSGKLRCFGRVERHGDETGDGTCGPDGATTPPWDIGAGHPAVGIASGPSHFCVALANGRVRCWGQNDHGQLGLGDRRARDDGAKNSEKMPSYVDLGTGRKARAVSAGLAFSCALLDDGHVKCWGSGKMLGIGTKVDRGGAPGQMGDALPDVDLGPGRKAVALASGPVATCVLLETGDVACWGEVPDTNGPCKVRVVGDEPGEMGGSLAPVALAGRATAIAVLSRRACALLDGGRLQCWEWDPAVVPITDGSWTPTRCGGVFYVNFGFGRTVRGISAGPHGTCALLDDQELICWDGSGPEVVPAIDFGE